MARRRTEAAAPPRTRVRLRSRDIIEHIERVLTHVRRLESSAETAVQIHFAAQNHRTNNIVRAHRADRDLPAALVTGFFGMNFEVLAAHPTGRLLDRRSS